MSVGALRLLTGILIASYSGGAVSAQDALTVVRRDGVAIYYQIELVDDPGSRTRGLMWRESLPRRTGMYFDFGRPQRVRMWMRNTLIPLDMLFVSEPGVLVDIKRNTSPGSLRLVGPSQAVRYVLEINGGEASEFDFTIGDRFILSQRRDPVHAK